MRTSSKLRLSAGSLAVSVALAASPAFAQDAEQDQEEASVEDTVAEPQGSIVVSGTRIKRPNLDSTVPITSVSADELLENSSVSLGDALNELPSLRSTFSQSNSNRFIGTSGLNLLDLRGLGTDRTLVLINGRRQVGALPGDFRIDVNTIPFELLERVDVITGGNSAIYGSEAVAGVVNFITARDFEGVSIRGQASVTDFGDRGQQFISVTAGQNFADGRGNIAVSAEYSNAEPLFNTDRDGQTGAFSGRDQFNRQSSDPIGPNTFGFFNGVRNGNITDGTQILQISCNTSTPARAAATCATDRDGAVVTAGGTQLGAIYGFLPNGRLARNQPDFDFRRFGNNNTIGGFGSTLTNTGQLAPGLDRYTVNVLGRYEVSPALEFFFEGKYNKLDALQEGQPTFRFGQEFVTLDNAFLNPEDAAFIDENFFPGRGGFLYSRFNVDLGGRSEINERETYRIVGGARGSFNDDWSYEIAVNYGRLDTFLTSRNQILTENFANAVDAQFDANGNIVCGINNDADTTNDDAACVPINIFGVGSPSQAAIDYVNFDSTRDENAEQFVVSAFVSGDLSQLFELPGGPIGFAVGGEYRRETSFSEFDPITQSGATFLNIIPTFDPPAFTEKSVFGEVRIPLLADVPFFNELTVEGAARYSDYNTAADGVFTWNAGGVWSPVDGLRFRGNFSRSIRVPNPSDLFSPQSQNFAFIADPCDVLNLPQGNFPANRQANCATLGLGANFENTPARTQSLPFLTGGNPLLLEEESDSYTIGFVFEPNFIPGFAFTADYYNIEITNVIAGVGAQAVLNNCFDAPTASFPNNNFCPSINPRDADGFFADPVLIGGSFNFAALETEGIDFDIRYNRTFDNDSRLSLRAIATYVLRNVTFLDIANPDVPNRIRSELGDPSFAMTFSANYETGALNLGYDMRLVGRQLINTFESEFEFNGNPPTNPNSRGQVFYNEVFYHDVRAEYEIDERFTFYTGVDNLTNELPPLGLTGTGGDSGIFDVFGRTYYAGFRIDLP
ncbi:hypothetical protein EH31_09625 [Erythrobacter longus]|uniref:TonB-dependent receptor n=1 Tax=Erythrobacter longus TaxID=1044 RepID=A0A074MA88_ERYLO|nr:TonB-dependent receptor [Erythrobacter longus]KEO90339.1 hypothetical protein EH31_09625 [Erythrobacter longus]